jgi:hypothetical protein
MKKAKEMREKIGEELEEEMGEDMGGRWRMRWRSRGFVRVLLCRVSVASISPHQ